MLRLLQVTTTGQWCAASIEADELPDEPDYAERATAAFSLQPGDLRAIDVADDPRGDPAGWLHETAPAPTPVPDPDGFKLAAYSALGASAFAMPLAGYIAPVLDSLNARNWALARQIIDAASASGSLSTAARTSLLALLAAHNIPVA